MKVLLAGRKLDLLTPEPPLVWLRGVRAWFEEATGGAIERTRADVETHGAPLLLLRLHPAAEDVSILAAGEGRVVVSANTASVGPGYHRWLCELLRRFGEANQVSWAERDEANGIGDTTGYFDSRDGAALEDQMLRWLKGAAARALQLRQSGQASVGLSMRFGHTFAREAPLVTPMGPRDDAWLRAVSDDPRRGTDVFPWWDPGDTPRARLNRAQTRLWTEMVWRPPLLDEERKAFRAIASLLESAWREDPTLAYPWREWRELLAFLGVGGTLAEEISRRAEGLEDGPRIGYRRGEVDVALKGGWSMRIPGSLAEGPLPDGSWVAREHRRLIRWGPLDAGTGELPRGDEREQLHFDKPRVRSHAAVQKASLTAICDAGNSRGLLSIRFDDADDRDWAVETWRSIDCRGYDA
jgi:hypothetical protein